MSNIPQRNFILGDEWLYYKIYSGPKTLDTILKEIIKPVTELLIEHNTIDKWFFIRYADPKHHLRVRFHSSKKDNIGTIINTFYPHFKKFVDQDLIWKLQTDTYLREIERYGLNTIDVSENLFYYDSKMVVDLLDLLEGSQGEELRWLFSLRAIDSLLNGFNYNDDEKSKLLLRLSSGFLQEFGDSKYLRRQLGDKFRVERKKIESFMALNEEDDTEYNPILEILKIKEKNVKNLVLKILELNSRSSLSVELDFLMSSYIHMFMNRIFKSNNRKHELVCYDFLSRHYKSILARK